METKENFKSIPGLSSLDHFITLVDNSRGIFDKLKEKFENAGFPLSFESGKGNENFQTRTPFIGREYFELLRIKKNPSLGWTEYINEADKKGVRGVITLFLRTYDINRVFKALQKDGLFVKEPYRKQYKVGRQKQTTPWRYLDLPPMKEHNIRIRWLQLDPMIENMMISKPRPNSSTVNGVEEVNVLTVHAPFTRQDRQFLDKVFPGCEKNNHEPVKLYNGALAFRNADSVLWEFHCRTENDKYRGKILEDYNFKIALV